MTPSAAELVAAVRAVPAGGCIATDADGTLWAADVGDDVVRCAAEHALWAHLKVDLPAYLARVEADYHTAVRDAAALLAQVDEAAARAALSAYFEPRLGPRRYLIDALIEATERGTRVHVVSASPRLAAEEGLRLLGLSWPVLAIEALPGGGFVEPVPVDEGKPAAWAALGFAAPDLSLGDSKWDAGLLRMAKVGLRLLHAERDPLRDAPLSRVCGSA
jgi:phosphoserine phosphatase